VSQAYIRRYSEGAGRDSRRIDASSSSYHPAASSNSSCASLDVLAIYFRTSVEDVDLGQADAQIPAATWLPHATRSARMKRDQSGQPLDVTMHDH
jgi:hypothetical protein